MSLILLIPFFPSPPQTHQPTDPILEKTSLPLIVIIFLRVPRMTNMSKNRHGA